VRRVEGLIGMWNGEWSGLGKVVGSGRDDWGDM